ncbi:MAG TPA: hypothetical protein VN516_10665 [Candidatus Baltobacteraceae bacterium]|nr:hypothetical protein [Candidatus Baltobacteraceae bacterium]
MSLINDALKQAKQSQSKTPPGAPPLPPLEIKRPPPSPWTLVVAIAFFALSLVILAIISISKHKTVSTSVMTNATVIAKKELPQITATSNPETNAPVEVVEEFPKVQGIIYDAVHPMAIVDRKTVRVGDSAGIYKISAISRTTVTFQRVDGSIKEISISAQ